MIPKRRVSYEDTHRTSGLGYPFTISAGLAFKRGLVLFGEFYRAVILDPSTPGDLAAFALQGFGPGLKYYRMPSNIFVAGSLLCARATMHNRYGGDYRVPTNISATSPWGVTALLSAGREWWISADWGLGIAGEFLLGRTAWYTAAGGSLLVSASFN